MADMGAFLYGGAATQSSFELQLEGLFANEPFKCRNTGLIGLQQVGRDNLLVAYSDEAGRVFRFQAGHRSDLKPATATVLPQVKDEGRIVGGSGQAGWSAGRCFRRLSPDSSIR